MKSRLKAEADTAESRRAGPKMEPLLTVRQVAQLLHVSGGTVSRLVDTEDLPAFVVCRGPGKRTLRFREQEVEQWLAGRRERQIRATLNGDRYTRRRTSQF